MEGSQTAGDSKTDVTDHSCPLANLVTHTFLLKLDQKVWEAALRSHWNSLLQAEQTQIPQLLLTVKCSSPDHASGLPLKFLQLIDVFLVLEASEFPMVFHTWSVQCWVEKADTSLSLQAVLLLTQPREMLAFSAALGQKGQQNSPDFAHA